MFDERALSMSNAVRTSLFAKKLVAVASFAAVKSTELASWAAVWTYLSGTIRSQHTPTTC